MSSAAIIEQVVVGGDLSKLSPQDRLVYYQRVCASLNLNPLTRPFEYLTLNKRLQLYAKKDCTDQLRRVHRVSLAIVAREVVNDCYVVTARATLPNGRTDESTGVVHIGKLKDEDLANAYMKAESKSKRRVTLSICGLGLIDESEIESVPDAVPHHDPVALPVPVMPPAPAAGVAFRNWLAEFTANGLFQEGE